MEFFKKLFLIILIVILIFSLIDSFNQYQKSISFYEQFKKQYDQEKYKNIKLKSQLVRKKSLFEIEKIIRNQLNLTKENEYLILLPPQKNSPQKPTPTPLPNYLQWWHLFVKNN